MKFRPLHDRVVIKRIEAERRRVAASSFRILQRKNLRKGRSLPSAPAVAMRAASSSLSTSRSATECCSASGRGPKSSSTASST